MSTLDNTSVLTSETPATQWQNTVAQNSKLSEMPDEELVRNYINGNNGAFDVLLERHKSRVYSYILYTVKNQELAEDIFQDIFMKVIVRLKKGLYSEHGKFISWLMRLAHNHVIDYFRTNPSEKLISKDSADYDILNDRSIAINDNREQELINKQTIKEIKYLINLLPENQREVVVMRYFDELSFKEIATKTNCSINTALGRMHYAIQNLRKLAVRHGINLAS